MRMIVLLLLVCLSALPAHAAELVWDAQTITSPLTVERSATPTGTYATVATLPTGATSYILTPGAYGFYRVRNSAGPSNSVQFSADLYTGTVTTRLDGLDTAVSGLRATLSTQPTAAQVAALTARVIALESAPDPVPPAPTSNLTVRQIDADHIEVTCNGIGITTSGSGTRRLMECRH